MEATIKFWKDVLPHYKIYVSEITVKELEDTKEKRLKRKFRELIKDFKILKEEKKAIKNLGIVSKFRDIERE